MMMLAGLQALQADPATQVILLVSKPPDEPVAERVLAQAARGEKPVVICFLGAPTLDPDALPTHITQAHTLEEAAMHAARLGGAPLPPVDELLRQQERRLGIQVGPLADALRPGQQYLRGLFSGGTLCYESQVIWQRYCPDEPLFSNAPLDEAIRLPNSNRSLEHTVVDLGEEEFTVGRPHPMIDNSLRIRRLLQEAGDPQTAVILLDVVLGYGAHPDPAAELAPAIQQARQAGLRGRALLIVITSVTGTTRRSAVPAARCPAGERRGDGVREQRRRHAAGDPHPVHARGVNAMNEPQIQEPVWQTPLGGQYWAGEHGPVAARPGRAGGRRGLAPPAEGSRTCTPAAAA